MKRKNKETQTELEFARLCAELDSAEAQAKNDAQVRKNLARGAREHGQLLARSKTMMSSRVVR